ncbi:hypothetical protein ILYODFUR_013113 [Ilyodon furcidens]|uniref:EGF-like domain-containing protein n=1 Tax=Ilyodon furcidens TaxID=33524 RepID=A0ABV0VDJ9_9TELE
MRMWLLCLWTSWMLLLRNAALQLPRREEGGVQPGEQHQMEPEGVWTGFRRRSTGKPAGPLQQDLTEPGKTAGWTGARRRAALRGLHVCGGRCCPGWTLSSKTRRCTKSRCSPPCRNGSLCRLSNTCLCRKGFHGVRCQFSKVLLPVGGPPVTSSNPTDQPASTTIASGPTRASRKPEPTDSDKNPLNDEDSGPLKAGSLAAQTEGDPGGVTNRFLTPTENKASSGSKDLKRTDPDLERQITVLEQVVLESKPQTESRNPHRAESLELKSTLVDKEAEDLTGAKRSPEEKEGDAEEMMRQIPSLREAQSVLLRNTLLHGGRGGNMATLLMKHITREKRKLHTLNSSYNSSSSSSVKTMRTFHNQRDQYNIHLSDPKGQR